MNPVRLIGAFRAANRLSAALAEGRKADPVDAEQLGLTEVMKRSTAAQTGWPDGHRR